MDRFQEVLHMNRNKIQEYLGRHVVFRYVLRRLVSLIPILLGVTLLTYGLMYDFTTGSGGDDASGTGNRSEAGGC